MSKKIEEAKVENGVPGKNPEKKVVIVNARKFTDGARKIATVTEKWYGVKPEDLQAGLSSQDLPQAEIKSLLDTTITIIGFQKRKGILKGKESEFLIILAVPELEENVIVLVCGGSVIKKKLDTAMSENALPVTGKIVETEGEDFKYYDFVS